MGISKPARLIEKAPIRGHPKRVPAERSVCLRKTPPATTSVDQITARNKPWKKVSTADHVLQDAHTGSSLSEVDNAGVPANVWFDDSNKNVTKEDVRYHFDDDSPFYLKRNESSSHEEHTSPEIDPASHRGSRRSRTGSAFPNMRTIDSSSEDYRSVIDDLTVENQKLRAKLKKYEKLHNSQSQRDKLFEIKVYALPPAKKRRLEKTLQDFASELGDCSEPPSLQTVNQSGDANSDSNSRDSGYASASRAASATQSHPADGFRHPIGKHRNHSKPHVHSTTTALPRRTSMGLSEKEKMELVVKRLERVFIGKAAGVAKSAPRQLKVDISPSSSADRMELDAKEYKNPFEGQREARMLSPNSDPIPTQLRASPSNSSSGETREGSIDQRPTHPIDLDPSRTQTPTDNIQYMKHLGFGSPKIGTDVTYKEGEGWIYLNLLVNMAQLHTINVTPDFVRKAVTKLSTHFELSEDGHRIRWKGGNSPTQMPGDRSNTWRSPGSSSNECEGSTDAQASKSSGPSALNTSDGRSLDTNRDPVGVKAKSQASSSNFQSHYKPVVFSSTRSSEDGMDTSTGDNASPMPYSTDSAIPSGRNRKERHEDGVKIYYNSSKFYTDLGKEGDRPLCEDFEGGRYVFGRPTEKNASDLEESKGPLSKDPVEDLIGSIESLSSSASLKGFEQFPTSNSPATARSSEAFPLQASGIGGVHPEDNFSIDVAVQHSSGHPASRSRIISENTREYPAKLPPPSYAFLPFESSSSCEGESSDDEDQEDSDSDLANENQREIGMSEDQMGKQPNMFLYAKELVQTSDSSN